MRQTPSSSAKRNEPIFELLPKRELDYSLSSITLTVYNSSLEELTKSKASTTPSTTSRIKSKITQHTKTEQRKITHFQAKRKPMEITNFKVAATM